jgi:hypothetical protein
VIGNSANLPTWVVLLNLGLFGCRAKANPIIAILFSVRREEVCAIGCGDLKDVLLLGSAVFLCESWTKDCNTNKTLLYLDSVPMM